MAETAGGPAGPSTLPMRRLGRAGFDVTALTLGGAGLGGLYGPVADEDGQAAIERAIDRGINYVDSSPFYGDAERRLGAVFAKRGGPPAGLHFCTKVGTHPARFGDYSAETVRWSVEQSLGILGVDSVDLVQVHALESINMEVVLAPGGAVDTLERLRDEGRLGAIGLGVRGAEFHRRAIASGRFDVILIHDDLSLLRRSDAPLVEAAARAHVGVLAGRALLTGLLAGPDPLGDPRLAGHPDAHAAHAWWCWAREREVPLQALALQYVARFPGVSAVVVGARSPHEVEENIAAMLHPIPDSVWREVEERVAGQEDRAVGWG